MKKIAAFFDVDETIINLKSMFSFYDFWCEQKNLKKEHDEYITRFRNDLKEGKRRELLNREYYQQFINVSFDELTDFGQDWFQRCLHGDNYIDSALAELIHHQKKGHTVVFVSGSMQPVLQPIADHLNVRHILCAPLIVNEQGKLTGAIGHPQTIGAGKREAIIEFCRQQGFQPEHCYAYGDDISDVSMLEATGHPVCVGDNPSLLNYAALKGWRTI